MKYLRPIIAIIGFIALTICTVSAGVVWLCLRALTGEAPEVFPIIRHAGQKAEWDSIEDGLDALAVESFNRSAISNPDNHRGVPLTHRSTIDGRSVLGRSVSMDDLAEAGESF